MLSIITARHPADFAAARDLIALMAAWDVEHTERLGLSTAELVSDYYSDTPEDLMAKFTQPMTGLLLGCYEGEPAGCIGFSDSGHGSSEIHKMFVRPELRGRGFARTLMSAVLDEMRARGFRRARLETIAFMTDAIALYRSAGFEPCRPFMPCRKTSSPSLSSSSGRSERDRPPAGWARPADIVIGREPVASPIDKTRHCICLATNTIAG